MDRTQKDLWDWSRSRYKGYILRDHSILPVIIHLLPGKDRFLYVYPYFHCCLGTHRVLPRQLQEKISQDRWWIDRLATAIYRCSRLFVSMCGSFWPILNHFSFPFPLISRPRWETVGAVAGGDFMDGLSCPWLDNARLALRWRDLQSQTSRSC